MTAPTNDAERHAMRLSELSAAHGTIRDLQKELSMLRTDYTDALTTIDVLNRTLAHRTDALTVAVAELAAVKAGTK